MKIEAGNISYAEAKAAHESGQKVEYITARCPGSVWTDFWKFYSYTGCNSDGRFLFRIAEPDPYAELKAAQAAGKVIQVPFSSLARPDEQWMDLSEAPDWSLPPDRYRVKPDPKPELTFEAGKEYRTRDGRKARVYVTDANSDQPIVGEIGLSVGVQWCSTGRYYGSGRSDHKWDLIDPWIDTPAPYDNWDKVPAWANWQAMDEDGDWCFYQAEPERSCGFWSLDGEGLGAGTLPSSCDPTNYTGTWENSLQERPIE